jgi:poly(3-hydroxybutyrate) depolymerase
MDNLIQSCENSVRDGIQITGDMYALFGTAMGMNIFLRPWAEEMKRYGSYLKEKSTPISPGPWITQNSVVRRWSKVALRKFNGGKKGNPLLIVPPEAGHNSKIVDYGPGQSLVQAARDHFKGDVYVMDKLPGGPKHATYSIDDCIRSLEQCIAHIGQPVHLVGLCQGGWQSAIYTALFPHDVKTLTLAGAPIDFHAGDGLISQWAQALPMTFYQMLVAVGKGFMPGAFITTGFKMMNAVERFIGDDINLYQNIDDPKYVERYRRFNQWYDVTQPLSGTMYLEVVQHLFKDNKLVNGHLEILGRKVDLSMIDHPLYLIAGNKDDITPPEQLFAIREHVCSESVEEKLADAGHIGVFMRDKVIQGIWTDVFDQLS